MRQPIIFRGTHRIKQSRQRKIDLKNGVNTVEAADKDGEISVSEEALSTPIAKENCIKAENSPLLSENDKPKVELSELLKSDGDLKELCDELLN